MTHEEQGVTPNLSATDLGRAGLDAQLRAFVVDERKSRLTPQERDDAELMTQAWIDLLKDHVQDLIDMQDWT